MNQESPGFIRGECQPTMTIHVGVDIQTAFGRRTRRGDGDLNVTEWTEQYAIRERFRAMVRENPDNHFTVNGNREILDVLTETVQLFNNELPRLRRNKTGPGYIGSDI